MASVTDNLNDLVERGEKDPEFRIACCARWRDFRDGEGIGEDLADYASRAFPKGVSDEQYAAIRAFPIQPLRLLRQIVVLSLGCNDPFPTDPPRIPPITLRFQTEQVSDEPASIRAELSGNNQMMVTFRAAVIV